MDFGNDYSGFLEGASSSADSAGASLLKDLLPWASDFINSHAYPAGTGKFSFMDRIILGIGGNLFDIVRRIGVWGALCNTIFLIVAMLYYQGNQKEMTRLVKNLIKTVIAFFFLVSLVGWVSLFQNA